MLRVCDPPSLYFQGERPHFRVKVPKRLRRVVEACWVPNPSERPTFSSIVDALENFSYGKVCVAPERVLILFSEVII